MTSRSRAARCTCSRPGTASTASRAARRPETLQSGLLTYFGSRNRAEAVGLRPCTGCRPGSPPAPRGQLSGAGPARSADAALFPGFRSERIRTRDGGDPHRSSGARVPRCFSSTGIQRPTRAGIGLPPRWPSGSPWSARTCGATGIAAARRPIAAHRAYSKRAMAEDQRQIMARLGFEPVRGGGPRPGRARGLPAGARSPGPRDAPRRARHRADPRDVGADGPSGRARDVSLALPRAARRPAGASDRRRPRLLPSLDPRELGRAG